MNKLYFFMILIIACVLPVNSQELIYMDTIEFRPQSDYLIFEDTLDKVWEIGTPSKILFNAAHSGDLAILTDSVNHYPDSCNDYFIIGLYPSYSVPETYLTFYHKYDTDTLTDGGVIEISYDGGETWINVIDDINSDMPEITNHLGLPIDTIQGGIYGYSGNSDGWEYVHLDWLWFMPVKNEADYDDFVLIRFRFISDGINTSKEGWMIDDIVISAYTYWDIETLQSSSITIAPIPASDHINIYSNDLDLTRYTIKIFDPAGRLRLSKQLGNSRINIEKLEAGMYFYQINNESAIKKTGKLVIK